MRKIFLLICLITLCFSSGTSLAREVSGSVSGLWTAAEDIYVVDDIIIESNKSLTVSENVNILVAAGKSIIVEGQLDMYGSEGNEIYISAFGHGEEDLWNGIHIINATGRCEINYVIMTGTIAGFVIEQSTVDVANTIVNVTWIPDNDSDGAFHATTNSNLSLFSCKAVIDDTNIPFAYTVKVVDSYVFMRKCDIRLTISDPLIEHVVGKGVVLERCQGQLDSSYIRVKLNETGLSDQNPLVGLYIDEISNFNIHHNAIRLQTSSSLASSAVQVHNSSGVNLDHMSIHLVPRSNLAFLVGIELEESSDVTVRNSVIADTAGVYNNYIISARIIEPNDSRLNVLFTDIFQVGIHSHPLISYENTYSLDPMWITERGESYHLDSLSGVLDLGDAELGLDPDDTDPDLGMHYYHQPDIVGVENPVYRAETYTIGQAYPNPFNSSTSITITLPDITNINATVHDILGRQVALIANGNYTAGSYRLTWNGQAGYMDAASGVYFIRISGGHENSVQKVVLLK